MTPQPGAQPEESPTPAHSHRWKLAAQGGPASTGSCECGATREFKNSWSPPASSPGTRNRNA